MCKEILVHDSRFVLVCDAPVGCFWLILATLWQSFTLTSTSTQEYTDNLDLTANNRRQDWITTAGLGLRLSTLAGSSEVLGKRAAPVPTQPDGIDLDYMLGLVFYAKNAESNYVSHDGSVNAWTTFSGRTLTLRLHDYFTRSQEPRERDYSAEAAPGQLLPGTQRERASYSRNVLEPSMEFRFGPENLIRLEIPKQYLPAKGNSSEDSQENFFNPILNYWFNIRHGLTLEYGYTIADFERNPRFRRSSREGTLYAPV